MGNDYQIKIQRLNRLGEEWFAARKSQEEDVCLRLTAEIFTLAYEIFSPSRNVANRTFEHQDELGKPNRAAVLSDFFVKKFNAFDPNRGPLNKYMYAQLNYLAEALYRKDFGVRKNTSKKKQDEEQQCQDEPKYLKNPSLDAPFGKDSAEGDTKQKHVEDEGWEAPGDGIEFNERVVEVITLIASLPQKLHGRANNPDRLNYFRMFFTDGMVAAIHVTGACAEYIRHERDMFEAMKLPFLDFFMLDICRTTVEVLNTGLKLYGDVIPGGPMTELQSPLPADVYRKYLLEQEGKQIGDTALSNQRKAYRDFLRQMLC